MVHNDLLLKKGALSKALLGKVSYIFINAMLREGFPMPGGVASVKAARLWLEQNPDFTVKPKVKSIWQKQ